MARPSDPGEIDPGAQGAERIRQLEETIRELRAKHDLLKDIRERLASLPERILMVNRVTRELNTLDLDRIAETAVRQIPPIIGAKYCSLFLYDYGTEELVLRAHNHPGDLTQRVSVPHRRNTVMGKALTEGKAVLIASLEQHERSSGAPLERTFADKYATQTCISAPLLAGQVTVGVLNFADREGGGPFDEANDLPVIEQLAHTLAMAIRNCNLVRELQNQARTDGLTRLFNYRAFHETLRSEMHRAVRYARPLALVMMDVDAFKEINDGFGHQGGDHALQELGRVIRTVVRREDLPARYGGDEIAIVLPETDAPGAQVVVERLIAAVRSHDFAFDGRRIPVSISMGVSFYRPEMTITEFVRTADEALYRAKQEGKNRYVIATAPA